MRFRIALAACCLFTSPAWAADPASLQAYGTPDHGSAIAVVQDGFDINGNPVPCGVPAVYNGCGFTHGALAPLSDTANGDLHATNLNTSTSASWLSQIYTWLSGSAAKDGTDGSGITGPTGAVGIRGWLSGQYAVMGQIYGWMMGSAATSALQSAGNTSLGTIAANTTNNATAGNQTTANNSLATIATNTGAGATAANQSTAQTTLGSMLTALGNIYTKLTGSLAVTGTFWQATQPVSGAFYQASQPVADPANAAFQGAVLITPGTATTAQRSIGFICSAAGNITVTLADGSTITLGIVVSPTLQTLPLAVTNIALGSGTAGTFWGMK